MVISEIIGRSGVDAIFSQFPVVTRDYIGRRPIIISGGDIVLARSRSVCDVS